MAKIIISSNDKLTYPVVCDSHANINNCLEIWIKFINHFKVEEIELMHKLEGKDISKFTLDEMEEYYRVRKQKEIASLFVKYKNRTCTKEEHDEVLDYMNMSLSTFIANRLTNEELNEVSKRIAMLSDNNSLEEYISTYDKKYDSLNVVEAYTLFRAKEKVYNQKQAELNEQIRIETSLRNQHLLKSLARDFGIK